MYSLSISPGNQRFSYTKYDNPLADSPPASPTSSYSNSPSPHSFTDLSIPSCNTSFDQCPNETSSFLAHGNISVMTLKGLERPSSALPNNSFTVLSPTSGPTPTNTPVTLLYVADDIAEPSRYVDYLSHNWREEDIWSTWRYIVSKRKHYGERSREENASWRMWAKQKYKLRTVPPDTLNWRREYDMTWLYGPIQTATRYIVSQPTQEMPKHPTKWQFIHDGKADSKETECVRYHIKKSMSASVVRQAVAAIEAEQSIHSKTRRKRQFMG